MTTWSEIVGSMGGKARLSRNLLHASLVLCLPFVLVGCGQRADAPRTPEDAVERFVGAVVSADTDTVDALVVQGLTSADIDLLRRAWTGSVKPSRLTTTGIELAGTMETVRVYALMRIGVEGASLRRLDDDNHGIEVWLVGETWKVARAW